MFKRISWASIDMFWMIMNAFLLVAIIGGLFGIGVLLRSSNAIIPSRTITVSGEGEVSVAPDLATIMFAVVSQGENPETIQKVNTIKINKAVDFLKAQGIVEKDIKTTGYNLYPRYRYDKDNGQSSIIGYELNQSITVKIRDLVKVGSLISGITDAGINQISSLQFSVEKPEESRNKAREAAFNQARTKAESMAALNGVSVARVISFSESGGGYPIYYESMMGKGGDGAYPAPAIQPGEESLKVQVSVTYEIR